MESPEQKVKSYNQDLTQILLTLETIRSVKALWKSKEITLRFDNRKDMSRFISLIELFFAIEEDILEEAEQENN